MNLEMTLLLRYRLAIARVGERDLFHWWESNALSGEGSYALGRLFRQTSRWAAIQLAIEAAHARHEVLVPCGSRITLFDLGHEIEFAFDDWLSRCRTENGTQMPGLPPIPEAARSSVRHALDCFELRLEETTPKTVGDRTIDVAHIDPQELHQNTCSVVAKLTAAYCRSERGKLLAPYMTLRLNQ